MPICSKACWWSFLTPTPKPSVWGLKRSLTGVVCKPRAGEGGGVEGLDSLDLILERHGLLSPPEAKNFTQAVALPSFVWQSVPVMEVSEGQRAPNWGMMLAMTPMNAARSVV